MNKDKLQEIKQFMDENLLSKREAMEITNQSPQAFLQAVNLGYIKPFYESTGTTQKVRLYLKSDMEEYRERKRNINKK